MNLAEEDHYLCFTCGLRFRPDNIFPCTEVGYPDCDPQLTLIIPPKDPPAHCGRHVFAEELKEDGFSAQCCKCHAWVQWPNFKEFQKGTCPNCGAKGF